MTTNITTGLNYTVEEKVETAMQALRDALWAADLADDYTTYDRIEAAMTEVNSITVKARLEKAEAQAEAATTGEEFAAAMKQVRKLKAELEAAK